MAESGQYTYTTAGHMGSIHSLQNMESRIMNGINNAKRR